jgi:hypothetical protein
VGSICGFLAVACYSSELDLLVAPGQDPSSALSAEAVLAHEYGHHIAAHRSNAPWPAGDYGTKRWASYMQVCANVRRGRLFPGADSLGYELNPGEAFAEAYRVLSQRRAGVPEAPWGVVSETLYPDDTALRLLEQDVTSPWQGPTTSVRTGSLTKATRVRAYTVATPLDGTLRVTLRPPAKTRMALDIYSPSSKRVAHTVAAKPVSLTTLICGPRTARIRVRGVSGTGRFRLAIATP